MGVHTIVIKSKQKIHCVRVGGGFHKLLSAIWRVEFQTLYCQSGWVMGTIKYTSAVIMEGWAVGSSRPHRTQNGASLNPFSLAMAVSFPCEIALSSFDLMSPALRDKPSVFPLSTPHWCTMVATAVQLNRQGSPSELGIGVVHPLQLGQGLLIGL